MREVKNAFKIGASFSYGDNIYSILGLLKPESALISLDEEGYEVESAEKGDKLCLRVMNENDKNDSYFKR